MSKEPRNPTGAKSLFGKALCASLARDWYELPTSRISDKIKFLHEDFRAAGHKDGRQFFDTAGQVLDRMQVMGTSFDVIATHRDLAKELSTKFLFAVERAPKLETPLTADDILRLAGISEPPPPSGVESFSFDEDVLRSLEEETDLNEAFKYPIASEHPLKQEMRDYLAQCLGRWTYLAPFYVQRSKTDASALMVLTSVGTHTQSNVKTNHNGTIVGSSSKSVQALGEAYLVFDGPDSLKVSEDYEGRSYFCWAVKIKNGSILKMWMSRYDSTRSRGKEYEERASMWLRMDSSAPKGYHLEKANHEDLKKNVAA